MKYNFIYVFKTYGFEYKEKSQRRRNALIVFNEIVKKKNLPHNGDLSIRINKQPIVKGKYTDNGRVFIANKKQLVYI